jgi:hypothetical protein
MRHARTCATPDGGSRFEDVEVEFKPVAFIPGNPPLDLVLVSGGLLKPSLILRLQPTQGSFQVGEMWRPTPPALTSWLVPSALTPN